MFISLFWHQITTCEKCQSLTPYCLSVCFGIKSQLCLIVNYFFCYCLSVCFGIKSQRLSPSAVSRLYCLSVCFGIKSQLRWFQKTMICIVYQSVLASNHNKCQWKFKSNRLFISLFWHQITTEMLAIINCRLLFISLFWHQITTYLSYIGSEGRLFISLFWHQITTADINTYDVIYCLSVCFGIKSQHIGRNQMTDQHCLSVCFGIKSQRQIL